MDQYQTSDQHKLALDFDSELESFLSFQDHQDGLTFSSRLTHSPDKHEEFVLTDLSDSQLLLDVSRQQKSGCPGCGQLKADLNRLHINIQFLKKKIISTDGVIRRFQIKQEECEQHNTEIEQLKQQLEQAKRDSHILWQQLQTVVENNRPLQEENERLESELKLQAKKIMELKDSIEGERAFKCQRIALDEHNHNLENDMARLKKHNLSLSARTQSQEVKIKELQSERKALNSTKSVTEHRLEILAVALKEAQDLCCEYWKQLLKRGMTQDKKPDLIPNGLKSIVSKFFGKVQDAEYSKETEMKSDSSSEDEEPAKEIKNDTDNDSDKDTDNNLDHETDNESQVEDQLLDVTKSCPTKDTLDGQSQNISNHVSSSEESEDSSLSDEDEDSSSGSPSLPQEGDVGSDTLSSIDSHDLSDTESQDDMFMFAHCPEMLSPLPESSDSSSPLVSPDKINHSRLSSFEEEDFVAVAARADEQSSEMDLSQTLTREQVVVFPEVAAASGESSSVVNESNCVLSKVLTLVAHNRVLPFGPSALIQSPQKRNDVQLTDQQTSVSEKSKMLKPSETMTGVPSSKISNVSKSPDKPGQSPEVSNLLQPLDNPVAVIPPEISSTFKPSDEVMHVQSSEVSKVLKSSENKKPDRSPEVSNVFKPSVKVTPDQSLKISEVFKPSDEVMQGKSLELSNVSEQLEKVTSVKLLEISNVSKPLDKVTPVQPPEISNVSKPLDKVMPVQPPEISNVSKPLDKVTPVQPPEISNVSKPLDKVTPVQPPEISNVSKPLDKVTPVQPPEISNVSKSLDKVTPVQPPEISNVSKPLDKMKPVQPPEISNVSKPLDKVTLVQPAEISNVSKPLDRMPRVQPPEISNVSKPLDRVTPVQTPEISNVSKPLDKVTPVQPPEISNVSKPSVKVTQTHSLLKSNVSKPSAKMTQAYSSEIPNEIKPTKILTPVRSSKRNQAQVSRTIKQICGEEVKLFSGSKQILSSCDHEVSPETQTSSTTDLAQAVPKLKEEPSCKKSFADNLNLLDSIFKFFTLPQALTPLPSSPTSDIVTSDLRVSAGFSSDRLSEVSSSQCEAEMELSVNGQASSQITHRSSSRKCTKPVQVQSQAEVSVRQKRKVEATLLSEAVASKRQKLTRRNDSSTEMAAVWSELQQCLKDQTLVHSIQRNFPNQNSNQVGDMLLQIIKTHSKGLHQNAPTDLFSAIHTCHVSDAVFIRQDEKCIAQLVSSFVKHNQKFDHRSILGKLWAAIFDRDSSDHILRLSYCRLFTALCMDLGDLEQARILIYAIAWCDFLDLAHPVLAVVGVWPQVLAASDLQSSIIRVLKFLMKEQCKKEDLQLSNMVCLAMQKLCHWDLLTLDENPQHLLKDLVQQLLHTVQNVGYGTKVDDSFEDLKAVELLLVNMGPCWTEEYFIKRTLVSFAMKWENKGKETKGPPDQFIICLMSIFCATVATLSMSKSSVAIVLGTVFPIFLKPKGCSALQLACVEALLELSPLDKNKSLELLKKWQAGNVAVPTDTVTKIQLARNFLTQQGFYNSKKKNYRSKRRI